MVLRSSLDHGDGLLRTIRVGDRLTDSYPGGVESPFVHAKGTRVTHTYSQEGTGTPLYHSQ